MRLFRRIGDIIAANLNDLVDRFEDPEVMLEQGPGSARVSRPRRGRDRRSRGAAGTGDLRSAGCQGQETLPQQVPDPAVVGTEGLVAPRGLETFGRPGVKVRRPCHNKFPIPPWSGPKVSWRRGDWRPSVGRVSRSGDLATTSSRSRRGRDRRSRGAAGTGDLRSAGCQGQETLPQQVETLLQRVRRGSPDPAVVGTGFGAGLPTPPWSGPGSARVSRPRRGRDRVRRGSPDPAVVGTGFGAGLPTPPWSGPRVSWRRGDGRPSVGRVSRSGDLATTSSRPRRGRDRRSPGAAGTGDLRSAGCQGQETLPQQVPDPAVVGTEGLVAPRGRETFGRPGVKVRRPCHNRCDHSGK